MKAIYPTLIGKRFGSLEVLEVSDRTDKQKRTYLVCKCDCGKIKTISLTHLRSGATKSCGCGVIKANIKRSTTHGGTGTRLYEIWRGICRRCRDVKDKYYGGRGISMDPEWESFEAFRQWSLLNGYKDNLTIDRIDPDKDYTPSNCRWIPFPEQAKNKRNNHRVTINGKTQLITEWLKNSPVTASTVYARIKRGWTAEKALTTPDTRIR